MDPAVLRLCYEHGWNLGVGDGKDFRSERDFDTCRCDWVAASLFAPLVLYGGFATILIGVLLWGISLGAQESIMRSYIAVIIPPGRRASAYGILYLSFGVFWFLGSTAIGILYDTSLLGAVIFSMAAQLCGAVLFFYFATCGGIDEMVGMAFFVCYLRPGSG